MPVATEAPQRARLLRQLDHRDHRKQRSFAAHGLRLTRAAGTDGAPDTLQFEGYASVTSVPYDIYGGPADGGWDETIVRGAFAKTLTSRADCVFLLNHRGMTLARTKSGTLQLAEDDHGLGVRAQLDPRMSDVADLAVGMERGDLDEMSFAFWVVNDRWTNAKGEERPWWDPEAVHREVLEVDIDHGDVSLVNFGANPHTSAALRAAAADADLRSRTQRDLILIALGDIELDGTVLTDSSVDQSTENETETETETCPDPAAHMRRLTIAQTLFA